MMAVRLTNFIRRDHILTLLMHRTALHESLWPILGSVLLALCMLAVVSIISALAQTLSRYGSTDFSVLLCMQNTADCC